MARNTKKLWAILLVVVMLTGMMPEFIVNAAAVTELRMDPRVSMVKGDSCTGRYL